MFKKLLLILIILCSILFFNFTFLGKFSKILELAGVGMILLLSIFYGIYDNSFRFKHSFSPFIIIILLSLPFSMYIADKLHNQSFSISLYAQRAMYYYLLYFVLHQIKIKPEDIEKIFIGLGVIYILLYLLQYILYPNILLFNTRITQERGTLRIFLAGMPYLLILYFYSFQCFLERHQLKHAILLLASLMIVIFIGSRSLLFTVISTTALNLIISKRIKSKLMIYVLSGFGFILIYFVFQNILQELIVAALQKDPLGSENIRFRAVTFFLSKFFPNSLAYIFGNGATGSQSAYSHTIEMISAKYGFYLGDIGFIGEYVNYGIIFVIGVFGILYKSLSLKIQPKYSYIRYFYIFTAITMIIGGGFGDSDFIVLVCITLYMLDVTRFHTDNENSDKISDRAVNPMPIRNDTEKF